MSRPASPIAGLALLAIALVCVMPHSAHAGVLYKCEVAGGVVAYTNKSDGFAKCSVLSRYEDSVAKKSVPPPAVASAAAPTKRTVTTQGWVYEENAKEKLKADFSVVAAGTETSAPTLAPAVIVAAAKPAVQVATASTPSMKVLRGSVYRVQRKDGITEYTNIKPAGSAFAVLFTYIATCVACDVHSAIDFTRTALNIEAYRAEIAAAASEFGVDSALLRAVIHAESAFNPLAVSNKGAQGLMQLMPGTAGDLGVTDAFDVAQNIRGGARYLAQLLKDFNGDAKLATAAYNAGAASVQKYGGVPPYDETQVYVQRVATLRDRYQKAL
ncbi:MAG: lytic transglycosylase domain-containing protein [Dokdonella sp.]